ncbi:MAG: hypothetical protein Q7R95_10555 [bacterium]|nr:hypothetical protein [bacterium]
MLITCAQCKYWRKIQDEKFITKDGTWPGPHGECNAIIDYTENPSMAWLCGNDGDLSLITQPDFSCSLAVEK